MPLVFTARFTPQAWVNDHAVDVDPQGATEWDATKFINARWEYFSRLGLSSTRALAYPVLDNDDVLHDDPKAPAWVRAWPGPFSIHVTSE